MTKPRFEIKLNGTGLSPETVEATDLATFLGYLRKAILDTLRVRGVEFAEEEQDEALFSLVAVSEGSNKLTIALSALLASAPGLLSEAVASGRFDALPLPAHQALADISKQAAQKNWAVEFLPNQDLNVRHAVISAEREVPPPAPRLVQGTTTIYGRCVRVGGIGHPSARIRLSNGKLLLIRVTEPMARRLAKRLYEQVGIEGQAYWNPSDWNIVKFTAARILDYRPTGILEAFKELADATQGHWDNVDVEQHVRELRLEDKE